MTRRKLLQQLIWPFVWLALAVIFAVAVSRFGFLIAVNPAL